MLEEENKKLIWAAEEKKSEAGWIIRSCDFNSDLYITATTLKKIQFSQFWWECERSICALMPLEHTNPYDKHTCVIAHLYMGLVFYPKVDRWSTRRWLTGCSRAPQNRCHERLRVKVQEEGKYDREGGERSVWKHEWALLFWHGDRT